MLGSALGASLAAPKNNIQGPRLGDLKVQSSAPGMPIPIVYGSARIAGNVIWSSGIREHANTQSVGGKGGGGGGSYTTYTYDVDVAIALCEGPIVGINKAWGDTQLLANGGTLFSGMTAAQIMQAVASKHNSVANLGGSWTLYLGTETQLPDPTMEAALGVGNVPAHRGLAYVVIKGLQLEKFGNRIPNFSFELVSAGTPASYREIYSRTYSNTGAGAFDESVVINGCLISLQNGIARVWIGAGPWNADHNYVLLFDMAGNYLGIDEKTTTEYTTLFGPLNFYYQDHYPSSLGRLYSLAGATDTWSHGWSNVWIYDQYYGGEKLGYTGPFPGPRSYSYAQEMWFNTLIDKSPNSNGGVTYTFYTNGIPLSSLITGYYIWGFVIPPNQSSYIWILGATAAPTGANLPGTGNAWWKIEVINDHSIHILDQGTVDPAAAAQIQNSTFRSWVTLNGFGAQFYESQMESDGLHIWSTAGPSNYVYLWEIGADKILRLANIFSCTSGATGNFDRPLLFADNGICTRVYVNARYDFGTSQSSHDVYVDVFTRLPGAASTGTPLSTVVSDLCTRSGLSTSQIDVTQLASTTVPGFVQTNQTTARSCIEPLQKAFFFDAIESDNKLKFVKRGGATAATIPYTDLVENKDFVTVTRKQELDLPKELVVNYIAKDNNYQQGTQRSRRLTRWSQQAISDSLPIVLGDAAAAQITEAALYTTWTQRIGLQFSVPRKYSFLEPTDVVNLQSNNVSYSAMLSDKQVGAGNNTFTAVLNDSGTYTLPSSATGISSAPPATLAGAEGSTKLAVLDIPILRAADDDLGLYVAVGNYYPAWSSAVVYTSTDSTGPYTPALAFNTKTAIGITTTVLGDWRGANIFDETNTVTVVMPATNTLSNATELAVLNGANACLIGNEIIQFKMATGGAGTYVLSGLLRGRLGTEWAQSTHTASDRFVLLQTSGILRFSPTLGSPRYYKALSGSDTLDGVSAVVNTDTAVGAKPLSPVFQTAALTASGDITINWVRRARKNSAWLNGIDVPLDEPSESYSIDIYSDSTFTTLKRTLTSSTPTATYTSAQIATDFGTAPILLPAAIYQVSSRVGKGYPVQRPFRVSGVANAFDPTIATATGLTLTNSGLSVHVTSAGAYAWRPIRVMLGQSTGRRYFEITVDTYSAAIIDIGWTTAAGGMTVGHAIEVDTPGSGGRGSGGWLGNPAYVTYKTWAGVNSWTGTWMPTLGAGMTVGILVDWNTGTVYYQDNSGAGFTLGALNTCAVGMPDGTTIYPAVSFYDSSVGTQLTFNGKGPFLFASLAAGALPWDA
jgi:hypothetical protein